MAVSKKKATSRKGAAAAATAVAPKMVLTKAGGAGKKDDSKLVVTGFEKPAARIRKTQQQIDNLTAEKKVECAKVIASMRSLRIDKEKNGEFYTTCLLESEDDKRLPVIFQDKYSKLDMENKQTLTAAFGEHYDELVEEGVDIKFRSSISLDIAKERITKARDGNEAFDILMGMIDATPYLKFVNGFMQRRASLRRKMPAETNDMIDELVVLAQADPQIRTK